jgi:hypothetical protein
VPTLDTMFPSRFLKAGVDVPFDDTLRLTITDIESVELKTDKGESEVKWAVFFAEVEKGLVLNKTNARTLARAFGEDTDAWTGKVVDLVVREVEFSGRVVPGLRVSIPKTMKATQTA